MLGVEAFSLIDHLLDNSHELEDESRYDKPGDKRVEPFYDYHTLYLQVRGVQISVCFFHASYLNAILSRSYWFITWEILAIFLSSSRVCLSMFCRVDSRSASFILTLVERIVLDSCIRRLFPAMICSILPVSVCSVEEFSCFPLSRSTHFWESLAWRSIIYRVVSQSDTTELTLRIMSRLSSSRLFCSLR
ncbi:hypothetical protein M070_4282 [Bacteroides fragilis str. A7 (UDC12-2)]|uniref:Uncharacterized protein n=1 Tax=Bacteroides fragilis TaxID=817 RepID=A0A853PQM8_BACFG|nr:hypothetical protein M074_2255 [Bacteroides fragilis str. DS-166]EXZ89869.1 hypothetical protein M068_1481 [Bacteroides fragilis str. J38-1]EYA39748.1 hypothetical protein M075_1620 [Bacteroides fragilis str. 20793-3]EYA59516.1 hypothetical protein M070_4282 [Bacteroides fragilis str. A7 (UDC12-2)]OCR29922.1 hypothetical protein AC094_29970 [Bacteroides fragilis]